MPLTGLEPKELWKHFDEIRKIPHCSGNETQLGEYVLAYAKERKFEADKDANGNIIVRVPATPGHEKAPVVVLQGHLDMVGEKNSDVEFDFTKDPIQLERDGDWLTAKGTTLGADNGVGLAAALAVPDTEGTVHGPLELLFTVDEEVGLTGAGKLEPGFVKGKRLLNLDTEELGAIYIGCSGGGDSTIHLPVTFENVPGGMKAAKVKVHGLRGGHSGIDIHEQRGNAIKILSHVLWKAGKPVPFHLASMTGGNKRNAIPREAEAVVMTGDIDTLKKACGEAVAGFKSEIAAVDPELTLDVEGITDAPGKVMSKDSLARVLNMVLAIPHGVEAMSHAVPGLVETSNNLATLAIEADKVVAGTSSRSSIATALQGVRDRVRATGELAGATVEENEPYPGWEPNPNSELLSFVKNVHKNLFGKEPEIKAIHAGLECGIIGEKYPGMEMVSFGPHIEHPHSPDERVNIPSVEKFWNLLKTVLVEMA